MSRHTRAAILAALAAALALGAAAETRIADIREGTNLTMALAPDGRSIALTLLGGLWQLPASGGAAQALTPTGHGAGHPRFDPDGRRIVYERFVDGQWDLWVYDTEHDEARALTSTPHDERHPDFMPDGESVVFASNVTGRFELRRLPAGGGTPEALSNVPGEQSFPSVSEQGEIAYVNRSGTRWSLRAIAASGADLELLSSEEPIAAPSWRPGGGVMLFTELTGAMSAPRLKMIVLSDQRVVRTLVGGEDVFVGRAAWATPAEYLYAADGRIWRRGIAMPERDPVRMFAAAQVEAVRPEPFRVAPDAPGPHAVAGFGSPAYAPDAEFGVVTALGDLWRFDARGSERLTDDAFVELDPAVLPDGGSIVYASDRGGRSMSVWQLMLDDGRHRQLSFGDTKAFSPSPDPTGRYVAYLATTGFDRSAESELRVLSLDTTSAPRVVARGLSDARDLEWRSANGDPLVTVRTRIAAGSRASRRVTFDLDGRRVDGGALAAAEAGEQSAAADELGLPELEWAPSEPPGRYAVEVGRLFDGVSSTYERDVDIHVAGGRIEAITPRGARELPERVIDLRGSTVIPGLIDTHAHESDLLGERLGRAWLAYGVTAVRDVGGELADGVQRAEAWASGRRPGPRLVVAPAPGTAPLPRPLTAGSPVRVERSGPLTAGLAHALGDSRRALSLPARAAGARLPLENAASDAFALPLSALGRSYQDVESAVLASDRYVGTGLAALDGGFTRAGETPVNGPLARLWTDAERRRWSSLGPAEWAAAAAGETIARLIRRGGRVGVGSEAPLTPFGLGLHRELELLEQAGIPSDQVLRLATGQAALALSLDSELGTLEAGKLADFVVIDGDPLARIGDTRRITDVVVGGVWHERAGLLGDGE